MAALTDSWATWVLFGVFVSAFANLLRSVLRWREDRLEAAVRKAQIAAQTRADAEMPAIIRAEIDQTSASWRRESDALVKKQIPRDPEYHRDHDIEEPITFYAAGYDIPPRCIDCGVTIYQQLDGNNEGQ